MTGGMGEAGGKGWMGGMSRTVPILCVLSVLCVDRAVLRAQFEMPDPKAMAGIPRPVDDLPRGSVSVRLIRGQLSNNITNHPVQLHVGSKVMTVRTDDAGRAQFDKVTPGTTVKATADVDGEHLESQEFPAPAQGGIRLMLVATDKESVRGGRPRGQTPDPSATEAPAIAGQVVIGSQSRIVMEPGDEAVAVYYLLDISNTASVPVNPPSVFMFDMPTEALGTALMEGSSKQVTITGTRVRVQGPFPPGHTFVELASQLPARSGEVRISQKFPANVEQLAVVVKKVGDASLSSPQISRQQEFPAEGGTYIAGTGGLIPAGQTITIDVTGLPHHSATPRWIALSLVVAIVLAGVWAARRTDDAAAARAAERKRLIAKRDKLLNDLVRLETDRRSGRADDRRYATRREELIAALEHIYFALDTDDAGPEPADRAGLAA